MPKALQIGGGDFAEWMQGDFGIAFEGKKAVAASAMLKLGE